MNSAYRIELSAAAEDDLSEIQRHLIRSYIDFGEHPGTAYDIADRREAEIRLALKRLAQVPHLGPVQDDALSSMRDETFGKAIYWFVVDDANRLVRILGIFYGPQDHQRRMARRILGGN